MGEDVQAGSSERPYTRERSDKPPRRFRVSNLVVGTPSPTTQHSYPSWWLFLPKPPELTINFTTFYHNCIFRLVYGLHLSRSSYGFI